MRSDFSLNDSVSWTLNNHFFLIIVLIAGCISLSSLFNYSRHYKLVLALAVSRRIFHLLVTTHYNIPGSYYITTHGHTSYSKRKDQPGLRLPVFARGQLN